MSSIHDPIRYEIDELNAGVRHTFALCLSRNAFNNEIAELKNKGEGLRWPMGGYIMHTGYYTPKELEGVITVSPIRHSIICLPYEEYRKMGRSQRKAIVRDISDNILNQYQQVRRPVRENFLKGFTLIMQDAHKIAVAAV